jgi:homoserine dehydrogenase
MAEKIIKIGLVGFGTVGAGVARLILEQADSVATKTGVRLQLGRIVDIDTTSQRPIKLPDGLLTDDLDSLLKDTDIPIGVELVGGTSIAKEIQMKLLAAGKDVVTANKALLAEHGHELYQAAHQHGRCIAFEASCAGGIPIISGLRTGLSANRVTAIYGIVNGTCNYILSNMTAKKEEFNEALAQAKQKGFAEADPTLDINGSDSAHKLAILASIAFGYEVELQILPKKTYVTAEKWATASNSWLSAKKTVTAESRSASILLLSQRTTLLHRLTAHLTPSVFSAMRSARLCTMEEVRE